MAKQLNPNTSVIGLDVGSVRIGVAVASRQARMPRSLSIISNNAHIFDAIKDLATNESANLIVVGLPRNMDGLETSQSQEIRDFAKKLQDLTALSVVFADESLSSQRAEGTTHSYKSTSGGKHLDDIAACFILEEFFHQDGDL